jgi:Phage stabilisation protein
MKSPILGSSYVIRSVNAADNRMVNLYPEIIPEGGKEPAYLQRCPGLTQVITVGSGPIRGLYSLGNFLYVVSGSEFYKVSASYTATKIGDVTGSGPVSMADNGTQIFIACNPDSYIYNVNTLGFAQITDEDFPGAVTVGYLDGYFVFNEPDSQRVWVTTLFDGTSIDPLDFASAEGSPDGLVSLIIDHREAWLFGTNSVEVWYNSGEADFPLSRIQGAYNEIGCIAPYSVAKMDNSVFWLGADARGQGIVYRAQGYQGVRVSTHAVEFAIQQYADLSDAVGYTYQQDGHTFYVLNFTGADTTWVYDAATGSWHERAGFVNGDFTRHRSNNHARFNGAPHVGDYQNGKIYTFSLDVYADDGNVQKWLRSWRALPTGSNNLKRSTHHSLQIDCETGVGLSGVDPLDPATELTTELEVWINTETGNPQIVANLATQVPEDIITQTCDNFIAVVEDDGLTLILDGPTVVGANPQMILRFSDDGGHMWPDGDPCNLSALGYDDSIA